MKKYLKITGVSLDDSVRNAVYHGHRLIFDLLYTEQAQTIEEVIEHLKYGASSTDVEAYITLCCRYINHPNRLEHVLEAFVQVGLAKEVA